MIRIKEFAMAAIIAGAAAGAAFAQPPADIAARLAALGRVVDPPNTAKLYAPLQKTMPQPGVKVQRDIAYGSGAKQTIDVFTHEAKPAKPQPILVFVRGGAFVAGDKSRAADGSISPFYDNVMLWALDHGMIGVNVNYTLAPAAQYPMVQHELAEVVALVRKNAAAWGGDPDRIVIWGHSAGAAHVGSFLAHPEVYADVAGARAPVAGAILSSGDYEMSGPKDHVYFGPAATLAQRSSTAGLIKTKTALMIAYAELDPEFMAAAAQRLDADLTKAGRAHDMLAIAKHSHMSESYAIGTADESVSAPMLAFIRKATK